MIATAYAVLAVILCASAAHAGNCDKTRDYILTSSDLPLKPQTYRDLSKMCRDTLRLSNVKEAFVLKAGAVAVIPKVDSVSATASILAEFCTRFPKGTLHFVTRNELRLAAVTAQAVQIGAASSTPCQKITGGG